MKSDKELMEKLTVDELRLFIDAALLNCSEQTLQDVALVLYATLARKDDRKIGTS